MMIIFFLQQNGIRFTEKEEQSHMLLWNHKSNVSVFKFYFYFVTLWNIVWYKVNEKLITE